MCWMGCLPGWFAGRASQREKAVRPKILILGLDNSGKTSLAWALTTAELTNCEARQREQVPEASSEMDARLVGVHCAPPPTKSTNVHDMVLAGRKLRVVDASGTKKKRTEWNKLAQQADGLIFAVDATDTIRFSLARHELGKVMAHVRSRSIPILILGTKRDLKSAVPPEALQGALQFRQLEESSWGKGEMMAFATASALEAEEVASTVLSHIVNRLPVVVR